MYDARGPIRRITAVDRVKARINGQLAIVETLVTKDCGHIVPHAHHFDYAVGSETRCYQCGVEARQANRTE